MQHKGTKTLETARLILRRAQLSDAQAMFDNWASDPEVTKYLTWPTHENVAATRWVLENWNGQYDNDECYLWLITLKGEDLPIGSISVVSLDNRIRNAEIGYCIGGAWWHRGFTSEAMRAVIDYLFDEVGMNRIEARHDPRNPHSGEVMRKCGMQYEGTARAADRNNQGICDACHYAILASER